MANRVRAVCLSRLGLQPTEQELWTHYSLCIGGWQHYDIPEENRCSMQMLARLV